MGVTRREFLTISGVAGAGLALSSLGIDLGPLTAYGRCNLHGVWKASSPINVC